MPNKRIAKENWMKRLRSFMKSHTSLTVIIAAALLLELTTGVMYYAAQNIIQRTVERYNYLSLSWVYRSVGVA